MNAKERKEKAVSMLQELIDQINKEEVMILDGSISLDRNINSIMGYGNAWCYNIRFNIIVEDKK